MNRLPQDLLSLILRYVPIAQRLAFASLVCKRWRAAAITATTSVSDPRSFEHAVRVLTALEHLVLSQSRIKLASADVLPRLRSLSLRYSFLSAPMGTMAKYTDVTSESSLRCLLEHRTTLTHIELQDPVNPLWHTLLFASAPLLTSLKLTLYHTEPFRVLTLDLPHLTSLSVKVEFASRNSAPAFMAALKGLIERTQTRLETLSVDLNDQLVRPLWEELASLAFPRVRRLLVAVDALGDTMLPAIPSILAHCHPSVRLSYAGPIAAPLATTALTELHIRGKKTTLDDLHKLLASSPHLTSISIASSRHSTLLRSLALSPAIPLIAQVSASSSELKYLSPLTALTSLFLSEALRIPFPPLPPFTSVTCLDISRPVDMAALGQWLALFPRLRTLRASIAASPTLAQAREVTKTLQRLEHGTFRHTETEKVLTLPDVTLVVK